MDLLTPKDFLQLVDHLNRSILNIWPCPPDDEFCQQAPVLIAQIKLLKQNTLNLRDRALLETDQFEPQLSPIFLNNLITKVRHMDRFIVPKGLITIVEGVYVELPPVQTDGERLEQVFTNFIIFITKYLGSGTILLLAEPKGPHVELEIQAQGGFRNESRLADLAGRPSHLSGNGFLDSEPDFFLFDLNLRILEKLGHPLTVAYHDAKLHIKFRVPVAALPGFQPTKKAARVPADKDRVFQVMVVDDEPTVRLIISKLLTNKNFDVVQAENGVDALQQFAKGLRPDLVLLDLMMPNLNGYEVCKTLRRNFLPSELPIIMLTAKSQGSDITNGFEAGANDYITKPFLNNELLARINAHLQLSRITTAYSRFVPRQFLTLMGHDSLMEIRLGEQVQKQMTILFLDIRSFTALSETMAPKENFDFLNDFYMQVSPVIGQFNGYIDKYIGDALMALFPISPQDALGAAIEMMKQIDTFNRESGYAPVRAGVGIHTGEVMLGTIGYRDYMQGTVIGDSVNLAARMENLTKIYGSLIMMSEQSLCMLKEAENYHYRFLDLVRVKGKKISISVFEIFDTDTPAQRQLKQDTKADFEQAVYCFKSKNFQEAKELFSRVCQINSDDKAANLYLQWCEEILVYGVPQDWDGVQSQEDMLG